MADDRERFERIYRENFRPCCGSPRRGSIRSGRRTSRRRPFSSRGGGSTTSRTEPRPWLFGVARRVIAGQFRSEARRDALAARWRQSCGRLPGRRSCRGRSRGRDEVLAAFSALRDSRPGGAAARDLGRAELRGSGRGPRGYAARVRRPPAPRAATAPRGARARWTTSGRSRRRTQGGTQMRTGNELERLAVAEPALLGRTESSSTRASVTGSSSGSSPRPLSCRRSRPDQPEPAHGVRARRRRRSRRRPSPRPQSVTAAGRRAVARTGSGSRLSGATIQLAGYRFRTPAGFKRLRSGLRVAAPSDGGSSFSAARRPRTEAASRPPT